MKEPYFSIGKLAKFMGISVRTLQYYDTQGLLSPSAYSEGGRRLYTQEDVFLLHQILSFKYLGFSLEDIKQHILPANNAMQIEQVLQQQSMIIKQEIAQWEKALQILEDLQKEVINIDHVDLNKYAQIIELLRMDNKNYWMWKNFDEHLSSHIVMRFAGNQDAAIALSQTYQELLEQMETFMNQRLPVNDPQVLDSAKKWWAMVLEFTGGDQTILAQLIQQNQQKKGWEPKMAEKQAKIDTYLGKALEQYFITLQEEPHECSD